MYISIVICLEASSGQNFLLFHRPVLPGNFQYCGVIYLENKLPSYWYRNQNVYNLHSWRILWLFRGKKSTKISPFWDDRKYIPKTNVLVNLGTNLGLTVPSAGMTVGRKGILLSQPPWFKTRYLAELKLAWFTLNASDIRKSEKVRVVSWAVCPFAQPRVGMAERIHPISAKPLLSVYV